MELAFWAPTLAFSLAVAATAAYVVGRRRTIAMMDEASLWKELTKAKSVVRELEATSRHIRRMLASHHASMRHFRERMNSLKSRANDERWREMSDEAERMLRPTMRLSSAMAQAYDEIRRQANLLMGAIDSRTDPLTGVNNRRAMEECLKSLFAMKARYNTEFSVAIIDIDQFKRLNDAQGHLFGDKVLQQVADAVSRSVRSTDIVARFGGEEFIVIMPHTELKGACVYAQRFREAAARELPITVSVGVTSATPDDSLQTLINRADTALYSAKSAGRNCVYCHFGENIQAVEMLPQLDVDELHRIECLR